MKSQLKFRIVPKLVPPGDISVTGARSAATKAGIANRLKAGGEWGSYGKVLAKQNCEAANNFAQSMWDILLEVRTSGFRTHTAIADELNRRGIPTPRNGRWHRKTVDRVLKRLGEDFEIAVREIILSKKPKAKDIKLLVKELSI